MRLTSCWWSYRSQHWTNHLHILISQLSHTGELTRWSLHTLWGWTCLLPTNTHRTGHLPVITVIHLTRHLLRLIAVWRQQWNHIRLFYWRKLVFTSRQDVCTSCFVSRGRKTDMKASIIQTFSFNPIQKQLHDCVDSRDNNGANVGFNTKSKPTHMTEPLMTAYCSHRSEAAVWGLRSETGLRSSPLLSESDQIKHMVVLNLSFIHFL